MLTPQFTRENGETFMAFISILATFIGLWAYWLFCSLFPLLGGR